MILKYVGYTIFALICLTVILWLLAEQKKQSKKKNKLMPFLEQQRDKASEYFEDICKMMPKEISDACDGKAYQYSWFNEYEWKMFSNLKSQYDSYLLFINDVEDDSVIPLYYSKKEYKNIYLFMKEIIYSINLRMNEASNKFQYEDSYLAISEFLLFHKIELDQIFFLPLKEEIDDKDVIKTCSVFGFNNVESPKNPLELAGRKMTVDNKTNVEPWKYEKLQNRKYDNLLKDIESADFVKDQSTKKQMIIWTENSSLKFTKNFKMPLVILNEFEIKRYLEVEINDIDSNFHFSEINYAEEVVNPIHNFNELNKKFGGETKFEIVSIKTSLVKKIIESKSNLIRTMRV